MDGKSESRHCSAPGVTKLFPCHINEQDLQDPTRSHSQEAGDTKGSFEPDEFKIKERSEGPSVKFLQPPKSAVLLQKDTAA